MSNVLSKETSPDIMESLRKALARVEEAEKRWERMTALFDKLDAETAARGQETIDALNADFRAYAKEITTPRDQLPEVLRRELDRLDSEKA